MYKKIADVKEKAKQVVNTPVPLGKVVLVTGGLIILTALVSSRAQCIFEVRLFLQS